MKFRVIYRCRGRFCTRLQAAVAVREAINDPSTAYYDVCLILYSWGHWNELLAHFALNGLKTSDGGLDAKTLFESQLERTSRQLTELCPNLHVSVVVENRDG